MTTGTRRPYRSSEETSQINALRFSRKLLFVAALVQGLVFAIPIAYRQRLFGVFLVCVAVLAVAGYVIAARNGDSDRDFSQDSVVGPNLQGIIKALLYIWLIVPFFNLPVIAFAYVRAGRAINTLTGK
jgi:hypothetical protein